MNRDIAEAVHVLGDILNALLNVAPGGAGRAGSQVRRRAGDLRAGAEVVIASGGLGSALLACFHALREAGAAFKDMDTVRIAALSTAPTGVPGIEIKTAATMLALSQEARIVRAMEFVSREDVDAVQAQINSAFDQAEESAADDGRQDYYRALVSLHSAVTRHLAETARPLPRIVPYSFPARMPSLALANRIYGDASRAAELAAENKVVHPLFCPASGRAMSA